MIDVLMGSSVDAAEIARLFRIMAWGTAVIWAVVAGLACYASYVRHSPWSEQAGLRLIVIGGAVVPTIVLAALLAAGMPVLARQRESGPPAVRITVIGEQFWWRVRYARADGSHVDLANEIRLPRGQRAELTLTSTDVIHSFWIPSLGGKVDMIPGRLTRLALTPTHEGLYRGTCAEYCGMSHAHMALSAEVMEPDAFEQWLWAESRPAANTDARHFISSGCAACHTIRGTAATSPIGPDLTHVASRRRLGAGVIDNDRDGIARWIAHPERLKPGVLMPPFEALSDEQLHRLAGYLRTLR